MGQIEYPPGTRQTVIEVVESEPFGGVDISQLGNAGSPITIQDDLDLAGSAIDDTTQGYLDLTGDGNDLRVGTGQSIEDGSGTKRFTIDSAYTGIRGTGGKGVFRVEGDTPTIFARSSSPFNITDQEGGFTAVQYDTDSGAGVLRTPNAGMRVEANGSPGSGEGLELRYIPSGQRALVRAYDTATASQTELDIRGNPLILRGTGGLVDMSNSAADLRLATGQAIEDGSGTKRFELNSNVTQMLKENGGRAFRGEDGNFQTIFTQSNTNFRIRDESGGFDAVEYTTSSSRPGTLELTNARLKTVTTAIQVKTNASGYDELTVNGENAGSGQTSIFSKNGEISVKDENGNETTIS